MAWRKPADRALVHAVIAAFRQEPDQMFAQLYRLPARAWAKSDFWLDASGLALYFHDLLSRNRLTKAAPPDLLQRLQANRRKNKRRNEALFREFTTLNAAFRSRGILYANHKGFTLCPHACPSPELRHQLDLDFLIAREHLLLARACLEEQGYRLAAATDRTWEFKAGDYVRRKRWDTYTMGTYRCVELHFGTHYPANGRPALDQRLYRLGAWAWNGQSFPALAPADQLIAQALHLFSHLRNESTRPAWMLEFRRHVLAHRDDLAFWRGLIELSASQPYAPLAFALSTLITSELFGRFAPPVIEDWLQASLPDTIRAWAQTYGMEAVLADFPGTKLYLLLETQLEALDGRPPQAMRTRLFPIRMLKPCFLPARVETAGDRFRRRALTFKFGLFRLRFHTIQAIRIVCELPRWRRLIRQPPAIHQFATHDVREMTNGKQLHDNLPVSSR